jgi:hypothetical protein
MQQHQTRVTQAMQLQQPRTLQGVASIGVTKASLAARTAVSACQQLQPVRTHLKSADWELLLSDILGQECLLKLSAAARASKSAHRQS